MERPAEDRESKEPTQVLPSQCLWDLAHTTKALSTARFRLEKLASRLLLTQQQIALFTQEADNLLLDVKASIEAVTAKVGEELGRVQSPTSDFSEIGDKFMLLLGGKRSWSAFKVRTRQALIRNVDCLKDVMSSLNSANLQEEQLTELLPIWKRFQSGLLPNQGPAATALLQFLSYSVEYKLKSEVGTTAARKLTRLQSKQIRLCSLIKTLESALGRFQQAETWIDISEMDEKLSADQTGWTLGTLDLSKAVVLEERTIGVSMLRGGTASGGVLGRQGKLNSEVSFPDFNRSDLYPEHFPSHIETLDLVLEGEHEVRWCGSGLFCM